MSGQVTDVFVEKRFLEKSRRKKPGNVKASETYVRRDIHCGISPCLTCQTQGLVPTQSCVNGNSPYILLPDAIALNTYLDLFETEAFNATQVVLLQTVLDQALDIASPREFSRIEAWLDHTNELAQLQTFAYFANKNMADTYIPALVYEVNGDLQQETSTARYQRAFEITVAWYASHAPKVKFVVLTDDQVLSACLLSMKNSRIEVLSCTDYIFRFCAKQQHNFLLEVARESQSVHASREAKKTEGTEYLDLSLVTDYIQGRLEVSAHHSLEAFVRTKEGKSIFIYGREGMNRAIHGDNVAVELLPQSEWLVPESKTSLVHFVNEDEKTKKRQNGSSTGVPTGRVINVVERASQLLVATILSTTVMPGDDYVIAVPMDIRYPKVRMRTLNAAELVDQRLTILIDDWALDSFYPAGHYVQILGPVGNLETEIQALLVQHAVHASRFSESALACLPDVNDVKWDDVAICDTSRRPRVPLTREWQIPTDELQNRRDLRNTHRVFSVDPPGCQDIDDAMSITQLPNGNYELGVHIADVSHFVEADSSLDKEAQHRATTVYLVDRRYDMLPVLLSGDLCSLHGRRDRLAFSVFWELNDRLEILPDNTTFAKTIVHSVAAMTYQQADLLILGLPADDPSSNAVVPEGTAGHPVDGELQPLLKKDLTLLTAIARGLYAKRAAGGAVDLSQRGELKFSLSGENESDWKIGVKQALEIHSTIAELMILANSTVAERLVRFFPETALLRRHVPPSGDRFEQLLTLATTQGLTLDTTSNMTLQSSLVRIESTVDEDTMALLKSMATRAMSEAEYICASQAQALGNQDRFGHYGLGLTYYTHFTSPIRRYADVVVHRQLCETLTGPLQRKLTKIKFSRIAPSLPASLTPSVLTTGYVAPEPLLYEEATEKPQKQTKSEIISAFPASVLVPQSQHMNVQNRNAKNVSRACEELFLALYFKAHTTNVTAVVTSLKQNGLLVFIPQFNVRGPLYLKDRDGDVHVQAAMVPRHLSSKAEPPKYGFASENSTLKKLPGASLSLEVDQALTVNWYQEEIATFRPLMEITVQVSCEFAASSARLPELRLMLVSTKPILPLVSLDALREQVTALHKQEESQAMDEATVALNRLELKESLYQQSFNTIEPKASKS
ncbi:DIS3-like exonuclease 1, partial [Thraustotheca clavata]